MGEPAGGYRAIVIGGTGAVGSALVRELLASPRCTGVVAVGRRALTLGDGEGAAKLRQQVVSMDTLEAEVRPAAEGCEVAFCTLGVGQPSKVSREELWKVDVEHATAFARACRAAGVRHISLLTAVGADARSRFHYLHVKGSVEQAFSALGFPRVSCFRPSLLVTQQMRYGLQDRVTQTAFPLISWMLPARLRQIRVEDLARAMRINAERPGAGHEVLHRPDCTALLKAA